MTDTFRALCDELLSELVSSARILDRDLIARAYDALAQPEEGVLTDEELDAKWGLPAGTVSSWGQKPPPDVAAAINRQLDRDIAAVIARRPAPEPPAEGEVAWSQIMSDLNGWLTSAADLLEQRHPAPVPVAWCRTDEFTNAMKRGGSFNGWKDPGAGSNKCDMQLFALPLPSGDVE